MLKLGTLCSLTVLFFYVEAFIAMIRNEKLKFGLSQLSFFLIQSDTLRTFPLGNCLLNQPAQHSYINLEIITISNCNT